MPENRTYIDMMKFLSRQLGMLLFLSPVAMVHAATSDDMLIYLDRLNNVGESN